MPKNKHLTDYERGLLEKLLQDRLPLHEIAARLGKHRTTIWREVRARSVVSDKGRTGTSFDDQTQRRLDFVLCHVNSYARASRADRPPIEVFGFIYGEDVAPALASLPHPLAPVVALTLTTVQLVWRVTIII